MKKKKTNSNSSSNTLKGLITSGLILICIGLSIGLVLEKYPKLKEATSKNKLDIDFDRLIPEANVIEKAIKEKVDIKEERPKQKPKPQKPTYSPKTYTKEDYKYPIFTKQRVDETAHYDGFSLSHNKDWKQANWVSYELTRGELDGKNQRSNRFIPDPKLRGKNSATIDYTKSGFDRGHLAPAADMTWSKNAMKESFYYSNISPQEPSFNRGVWKRLEKQVREWAERDSAIVVITGPIVTDNRSFGKNKVAIPSHFFKVIISPYQDKKRAIAFLFKNEGSLRELAHFAVPVDHVEGITGMDFFSLLPDQQEDSIESTVDLKYWFD